MLFLVSIGHFVEHDPLNVEKIITMDYLVFVTILRLQ